MAARIVGLGGSRARPRAVPRRSERRKVPPPRAPRPDCSIDLPTYNPDDNEPNEAAAQLIESCYAANGLLWSRPLYQGTISSALKNALDWLLREETRRRCRPSGRLAVVGKPAGSMRGYSLSPICLRKVTRSYIRFSSTICPSSQSATV
jgi:hypothetical protein